jgi:hypothetical protein
MMRQATEVAEAVWLLAPPQSVTPPQSLNSPQSVTRYLSYLNQPVDTCRSIDVQIHRYRDK